MPLTKDITFKCPECGEEIPLTLWQSVNTAENPKEAEALAYGDLFYIQCPKCGYQTMANLLPPLPRRGARDDDSVHRDAGP